MAWDLTLLKKFSTTNHYRLLSQVRAELKKKPIIRETLIRNTKSDQPKDDRKSTNHTTLDSKVVQTNLDATPPPAVKVKVNIPETEVVFSNVDTRKSFRQRLNEVDMR